MLPYRKLKQMIDIQIGDIGYSSSQLQKKTLETAVEISAYELSKYKNQQLCLPFVETEFDLYCKDVEEVLLFEDGIRVKRQKDKRNDTNYEKPTKRVQTDVIAIEVKEKEGFNTSLSKSIIKRRARSCLRDDRTIKIRMVNFISR